MDEAWLVRTSTFLSKHPRHQPGRLGLDMEPGGWVAARMYKGPARGVE